jgi:hypothetical protein
MPDISVVDQNPFSPDAISKETVDFNNRFNQLLSRLTHQYSHSPLKSVMS